MVDPAREAEMFREADGVVGDDGLLFETPCDALGRVNLWCSAMAGVMVAGIFAMWILTEVVR